MEGLRIEREANRHRNLSSHIFDHSNTSFSVATNTSSSLRPYQHHPSPHGASNHGKTTASKSSHPLPVSARRPLASCLSSAVSTPGALPSCPPAKPRDSQKSRRPPLPRKGSVSEGSHRNTTMGGREKNLRTSSSSSSTVVLPSGGGGVHTPAAATATSSSASRSLVFPSQGHNTRGTATTATTTTTTTTVPRSPSLTSLRSSSSLQCDNNLSKKGQSGVAIFPRETRASRLRREAIRSRSQSLERKLLRDSGAVGEESSSLPPPSSSSIQSRPSHPPSKSTSLSYPGGRLHLSHSQQSSQSLKSSSVSPAITSHVDLHTSRKSRLPSLQASLSSSSSATSTTAVASPSTQPASCVVSSLHPCSSQELYDKTALHPLPSDPIDSTVIRPAVSTSTRHVEKSIFPKTSTSSFSSSAVSSHPRETAALPTSSVSRSSSSGSSSSSSLPSCLSAKSSMVSSAAILHTNVRAAYPFPFPSAARKASSLSSSSQSKVTGLSPPPSSISSLHSFPFIRASHPFSWNSSFSSSEKQQQVSQILSRKKGTVEESEKKEEEEKTFTLPSKTQLPHLSSTTSSFPRGSAREISSTTHDRAARRRSIGKDLSLFPRERENGEMLEEKKTDLVEEATKGIRSTPFFPPYNGRPGEVLSSSVNRKIEERRNQEKDEKEEENEADAPLAPQSSPSSSRHSSSFISGLKDSVSTIMSYLSLGLSKGSVSSHHAVTSTPRTRTADTTSLLNPYTTSTSSTTQENSRDDREGEEEKKKKGGRDEGEEDERPERERVMKASHMSRLTGEEGTTNSAKRSMVFNGRYHRERQEETFLLGRRGRKISEPGRHNISLLREERREGQDGREVHSRGREEEPRRGQEERLLSAGSTKEDSASQVLPRQLANETAATGWLAEEKKKNVFLVENGEGQEEDADEEERPAKRMCRRGLSTTCQASLEKERRRGRRLTASPRVMGESAKTSSAFFSSSSSLTCHRPLLSSKGSSSSFSVEGVLERDRVVS